MKYTKEERLVIGRRIYEGRITTNAAAEEYGINFYTARDYLHADSPQFAAKNLP